MHFRSLAICLLAMFTCLPFWTEGADKLTAYGLGADGKPLPSASADEPLDAHLVFHGAEHGEMAVEREAWTASQADSLPERVRLLVELLVEGPTATEREELGAETVFPTGTQITDVTLTDVGVVEIRADFPEKYLQDLRTGQQAIDEVSHLLSDNFLQLPVNGVMIFALDHATGEFVPLEVFEPKVEWESGPSEPDWGPQPQTWSPSVEERSRNLYPRPSGGRPSGGLNNRTVYLNAGHGWTWRSSQVWGVQRGFVFNNVEDFSNADLVHGWVQAYMHRAGADVFHVREMDPNPNMVLVDNNDGAPNYIEMGAWSDSTVPGFANGRIPYVQGENPFSFGTNRLVQCVVGEPTATATWIPTIPAAGFYNVYVSHAAFTNRSPQAQYKITHAGGESEYFLDQRRHRMTWIFVGRYFFEAGRDPNQAKVVLTNSSTSAAHFVSADAVRFGGGRGIISRGTVGTSPYPNHDNEAIYNIQFMGAPSSIYQSTATPENDESKGWSGRPLFGRWLETRSIEYGSPYYPAVFLTNHTNATSAGTARGTISYLSTSASLGGIHDRFRVAVHNQVVRNLSDGYGGTYIPNSNPLRSGAYGENNPSNINGGTPNTVPIFLGEWMFHDNATDMALYHDPKFRRLLARGIYQGIVDHFASEVGGPTTYLPEPPRNLRVRAINPTVALLQWQAPPSDSSRAQGDPATGYKVYRSTHGRGFAMGTAYGTLQAAVQDLTPGETYFFQVTATNQGGESFPTETLAVRMPLDSTTPNLLIVNGYDKLDIATRVQVPYSGSVLYRQYLDQMNTQDYIVEHARAIAATELNVTFDSAEHDAVEAGLVTLTSYDALIWIGGLQSELSTADPTDDTALKSTTRTLLSAYLASGGKLFISGAETGWDLNRLGQSAFMNSALRMNWASEGPQAMASGKPGSIFEGLSGVSFGGAGALYPVYFPDVILPVNGATIGMEYGTFTGTTVVDGFEGIGQWRQPSFSGQTNADPSSTFAIVSSPTRTGTGSGRLNYVWGSGNYIRLYNQGLPQFPAASDFSSWMFGDNSGHQVRICLRDSDNDLFVTDWMIIDFTGWREILWEDIANNPKNVWVQSANGLMDGPNVRLDSIHVQKVTGLGSGNLYFDDATCTPLQSGGGPDGPVAAIQYDGESQVVYMGFPFETISSSDMRTLMMGRVLDFFGFVSPVPPPPTERDQIQVY